MRRLISFYVFCTVLLVSHCQDDDGNSGDLTSTTTAGDSLPSPCVIPPVHNGKVTYRNNNVRSGTTVPPGALVAITCNSGYRVSDGVSKTSCLENGDWQQVLGDCTKGSSTTTKRTTTTTRRTSTTIRTTTRTSIITRPPSSGCGTILVDNGSASSGSSTVGSVRSFQCNPGFAVQGKSQALCLSSKTWQLRGKCVKIDDSADGCGPTPLVPNGRVEAGGYAVGDQRSIQCNPGYTIPSGEETIVCQESNDWSTPSSCTATTCDLSLLPAILNGKLSPSGGNSVGSSHSVICDSGYQFQGLVPKATCQSSGDWTRPDGQCRASLLPTTTPSSGSRVKGAGRCGASSTKRINPLQQNAFFDAAFYGNLAAIKHSLQLENVDVNLANSDIYVACGYAVRNASALHLAILNCTNGEAKILQTVQALIGAGANVSCPDMRQSATPMHLASYFGFIKVAQMLLDNGADVNVRNENNTTPLHYAAGYANTPMVQFLLDHGASSVINEPNTASVTPAILAARADNNETLQLLISKGANTDDCYYSLCDPLATQEELLGDAAAAGNVNHVRQILTSKSVNVNWKNIRRTYTVTCGLAKLPLSAGTALHRACQRCYYERDNNTAEVVKLLINAGANVNSIEFSAGLAPLHYACASGDFPTVKVLIDKGATVNAKTSLDYTPLMYAAAYGNVQTVRILLDNGAMAVINDKQAKGETALSLAVSFLNLDIAKLLLERGASRDDCLLCYIFFPRESYSSTTTRPSS